MARTCIFFDIDFTLLDADGASRIAMSRAFEYATGIADGMAGIQFAGRTDRWIVQEAARRHGARDSGVLARHFAVYPPLLREEMARAAPRALPGAVALLERLARTPDVALGLVTGNMEEAARIKLAAAAIDVPFAGGGFGDESEDRADIVRAAMIALECAPDERLILVGDSEHDIWSAAGTPIVTVGVATGHRTVDELRGAGAHLVFADFVDTEAVLAQLLGTR